MKEPKPPRFGRAGDEGTEAIAPRRDCPVNLQQTSFIYQIQ
ncbi:hypothetical protein [Membranihabitans marinus]|nr:hypothetical protein [Membranihabitans marinus]